jgi:maltose O-acetyltransferase
VLHFFAGLLRAIMSAGLKQKMKVRLRHLRTEKDKMQSGSPYDPSDRELWADRCAAQRFMADYNRTNDDDIAIRDKLLKDHLGFVGAQTNLRAPLYVDYGYNIFIANNVFLNYGCVLLDVCKITIGPFTQIGPSVQMYTADHPQDSETRRSGIEFGRQISIGANVWIGGNAIILPGTTIGDNAIIGAGSVVTRDVAAGAKIAGNPARALG